jgi:hypothetical protein
LNSADPAGLPASHRLAVDWTSPGPLTPAEKDAVVRWYAEHHGDGNLDRARFIAFWFDHDSAIAKHYGRWDVRRAHLLPILQIAMVYTGDMGSEAIAAAVEPLLEEWPA